MNDAIRPDEPGQIITDPPPAPTITPDDFVQPRWRSIARGDDWIPLAIGVVYLLAFVAPITLSETSYAGGFILFLWGAWFTSLFPFLFWEQPGIWLLVCCWLANPLFWIGLGLIGSRVRSSRLAGGVLGVFAVLAALLWMAPGDPSSGKMVGPAYLLWCGSFVMVALVGLKRGLTPDPLDLPD